MQNKNELVLHTDNNGRNHWKIESKFRSRLRKHFGNLASYFYCNYMQNRKTQ